MTKALQFVNILLLLVLFFLCSCKKEIPLDIPAIPPEIVVDGWIESGDYPYVILTRTSQYFSNIDSTTLRNLVLTRAKVSVTDSVTTEILTLVRNDDYFPPYLYRGTRLKGEIGKKYYLKVEYAGRVVTAETTIPKPLMLDSLWYELREGSDSLGVIKGMFTDNANEKNYYKAFTKIIGKNTRFVPTLVSNFDDKYFNGEQFAFELNRGQDTYLRPTKDIYFELGDSIILKACTLDKAAFSFWLSYQDEIINAPNPFASSHKKVLTNINNGLGIWAGYGATNYLIVATPKNKTGSLWKPVLLKNYN
jgi:hypothetical protein